MSKAPKGFSQEEWDAREKEKDLERMRDEIAWREQQEAKAAAAAEKEEKRKKK